MFKMTCPSCHKVLSSKLAIPAGKKIKCPACGADIPLSSGWGPVGDKRFRCSHCGEDTELCTAAGAV